MDSGRNLPRGASIAAALVGVTLGAGFFTFAYGRGYAYLTNDPAACANCHVMNAQYDAWQRSSHRAVAACNDCHTPHNLAVKYLVKAENGFRHSWAFTTGWFHEPITITPRDRRVTERRCRECHEEISAAVDGPGSHEPRNCTECHADVGHRT